MDNKTDLKDDLAMVEQHLMGDQAVWQAWGRVSRAALRCPSPPARAEQASDGAARFSEHLYRMASEGVMPLPDSQGMERLFFRWVVAAEGMTALLEQIVNRNDVPATAWHDDELERFFVDELYQPAYCDECGCALHPDGRCVHCEKVKDV